MRFVYAAMILVVSCVPVCPQSATLAPARIKVEAGKPTVYLTLERRDKEKVWLRMNHNTGWAIAVRTISFYFNRQRTTNLSRVKSVFTLPNDKEIDTLHYYVEAERGPTGHIKAPKLSYPDSSSTSWIPAEGSILFSVPVRQLKPGLMIYVPFQYEWELNTQLIFNKEPEHRVYFRGVDLSRGAPAVKTPN